MRALGRYVVLRKVAPQTHVGSIELPPHAKHGELKGVVLSVGSEVRVDIKEGDVCVYAKFAGDELDEDTLILHEKDLIAVLEVEDDATASHLVGAAARGSPQPIGSC